MGEEQWKVLGFTLLTLAFSKVGILFIPFCLLFLNNIIDYVTGLLAAKFRDEDINSYKSFKGIAKKIGVWLLVIVAALMDIFFEYEGSRLGITLPSHYLIASLVIAWLFVNETISILENLNDMQVSLPPFILPIAKRIRSEVEAKAEKEDD